jgi:hypothetical protein
MYDAGGVAQETPTFVAIHSGSGALFSGARDAESFVSLLEAQLAAALETAADGS